MADLPTRLDLFAIGRNYVRTRTQRLDPNQVDILGSDINIFVGASSQLAYFLVLQLAFSVNRLLLDGAEGEDLDRYAYDRYTLTRPGASPAVVPLVFNRLTNTVGAGTIPTGTTVTSASGIQYVTTSNATFGTSDLTSTANAVSTQAGKAFQVGANTLTQFVDPSTIFDASITVNNVVPAAGGEDVLTDDLFRVMIRKFWLAARRGTLSAIEFGALLIPGVTSASASEALTTVQVVFGNGTTVQSVSQAFPARIVNLYVADSTGVANQVLANTVRNGLGDYRAGGITVIVFAGLPQIVNIELSLAFLANVDTVTLTDAIIAALVEYVNSIPVNGTLLISGLYSVLQRFVSDGLVVTTTAQGGGSTIVAPTGDLIPNPGQTIRTTTSNVTVVS